ncbi:MAG: CRISPR-associated protein Cas4 [Candidatus Thorarchaeota archaeon]|nr:MAG: CRISPR-associated protein Cas4 [Candidatus Thorarchaeota archaeon]
MKREFRYSETKDVSETYITPTDVKQYVFCPRVTYFTRVMHLKPIMGSQQEAGRQSHNNVAALERRRKRPLKSELPFIVREREFEKSLESERLGVRGRIDLLLVTDLGEMIPVEIKMMTSHRGQVLFDHKYQLVLLGLLIEDTYGCIVRRGIVHYLNDEKTVIVPFTASLKRRTEKIVNRIREMLHTESMPEPRRECRGHPIGCGFADRCRE